MQQIDDTTYKSALAKNSSPYMLYFSAPWCGPCRLFRPTISQASVGRVKDVTIFSINVDNCPEMLNEYKVASVPTTLGFSEGAEVFRLSGAKDARSLNTSIDSLLTGVKS